MFHSSNRRGVLVPLVLGGVLTLVWHHYWLITAESMKICGDYLHEILKTEVGKTQMAVWTAS